jgi:hypothetical protein
MVHDNVTVNDCVTVIDCETCVMRSSAACADCVVTFLCERPAGRAVEFDGVEVVALRRLAEGGLAPALRHAAR